MPYLFTSESVSEGHPDKIADQISDALVDHFLAFDPNSKIACETMVTTGQVILAGEVKTKSYIDVQNVAREVISKIGYTNSEYMFEAKSCGILSAIHEQSPDINRGVEKDVMEEQGAGDQGMMFGYATKETDNFMPLGIDLSHRILKCLSVIRKENTIMPYLRPDAKAQVTVQYSNDHKPIGINNIVLSTQHDEFDDQENMLKIIKNDIFQYLIPYVKEDLDRNIQKLFDNGVNYFINPTGKFVIGGPHGDAGLTGRKIIVDTYGGKATHGGGAFSGKDPSKVDRSGAYATRHIAKNLVAAGVCDEVLVQVSYAIGMAKPTNLYINTYGTSHIPFSDDQIAIQVLEMFDMRPYTIEQRLKLRLPIYSDTAAYGHMGRNPESKECSFTDGSGNEVRLAVETFTWEKLDYVEQIRKAFKL